MKNYSKLGTFASKGRLFKEASNPFRSPFQRDRDRIIHSTSFRRLKHKTQVFVNTEGDHYRTRITHSIEVSQIARTIAKYLGLNDDLAETLSLAHDLGHTPFGHAGEESLNECMYEYGGFDHNLQTLRIVMFIENKYFKFQGLNLTLETLEIKFKDKSIADVLNMTVDEGCEYFENISNIKTKLLTLKKVGLGYIKIGQQATTLSGGEAQRIKLAKELSKRSTGRTMYILDEPTTGLHQHDIKKLLEILHTFVATGNSVVVIEHNLDVIKTADYIVDMGPEGGVKGGNIIAEGKPEEVAKVKDSYTGKFLKPLLDTKFKKTA